MHTKGKPITKEQIREAVAGWNAYTSSNPIEIETWITTSKAILNSFGLDVIQRNTDRFSFTGIIWLEDFVLNARWTQSVRELNI